MRRAFAIGTAALAVAVPVALGFGAAPAQAQTPCWKRVINDWYDGRIDGDYSVACLRQALKHAPEDLREYSDLPETLQRTLAQKIRRSHSNRSQGSSGSRGGGSTSTTEKTQSTTEKTPSTTERTQPGTGSQEKEKKREDTRVVSSSGRPKPPKGPKSEPTVAAPPAVGGADTHRGFLTGVFRKVAPGDAESIPVPLIVLAALALLLMAAGAVGMTMRRLQPRRPRGGPPAPPPAA